MSYLVFARKFRPQNFDEVIGQEHITNTLKNAIKQERVAHAYLFAGPRGIGKTSCARILAKSLNCQKGPTIIPCDKCANCVEIGESRSFDVIEIDGASNRGIDEIRSLRENVKFSPSSGKYKIYIIDEVHMLTTEAFNALLKTLEEPPAHVKFIFATTQPNKLLPTILSRCQRFEFRKIPITKIIEKLDKIAREEKLSVDKDALFAIAKAASGSMRDAESILDQLSAFSREKIRLCDVTDVLGMVEEDYLFEITDKIFDRDTVGAIRLIDTLINEGKDTRGFISGLIEHFRNLLIAKIGGRSLENLLDLPPEFKEKVFKQAMRFSIQQIINSIETLVLTQEIARKIDSLRIPLEVAVAKLTSALAPSAQLAQSAQPQEKKIVINKNPQDHQKNNPIATDDPINSHKKNNPVSTDNPINPKTEKDGPAQVVSEISGSSIGLKEIEEFWPRLIDSISKEKMSVATFLQEGKPMKLDNNVLTVGFLKESNFHKELLERKDNRDLIETNLKQILENEIKVNFEITPDISHPESQHEPFIKSAIDTFKGRLINKWHKRD